MRSNLAALTIVLGLVIVITGCAQVERAEVTRGDSFDLGEALDLQQATYTPVYEVIMGSYPEEGPPDERFETRKDTVEFLSSTFSAYEAGKIANAFFDSQGNRRWDSFFPTIFHDDVTIVDAYFEQVTLNQREEQYLVIEEQYAEGEGDNANARRSLYVQDCKGRWKCIMIDGFLCVSGPTYYAHGRR